MNNVDPPRHNGPLQNLAALPDASLAEAAAAPPRLLDQLRHAVRVRHCSIRTEVTFADWARRLICFTASAIRPCSALPKWRRF